MGYFYGHWFYFLWFVCVILTGVLAANKNRNVPGWVILALFCAPLALILILFMPKRAIVEPRQYNSDASLPDIKTELEEIKSKFNSLLNRIEALEFKINILSESKKVPEAPPEPIKEEPAKIEIAAISEEDKADIEMNVGKFWLNKIGIIVFTLGIGFLISYTFRYFGALAKIMFGYLVSASLFFFGTKLEKKERFINYGRVLLGGAWAIVYFTTYAMYHFDASRIIDSQLMDLLLLGIVAAGIIMHSLKYKSQELSAVALFIGYITATLGNVTYFTFLSCVLLAGVTLVLVYKLQWLKIIFLGIVLTYLTHYFWVIKQIYSSPVAAGHLNVNEVYFLINSGYLFVYWSVFTIGIHLIKQTKDSSVYNKLSAANFCNFLLFFFMTYPKLFRLYPNYKFTFMFGLGIIYLIISVIMEIIKNDKLFISNILISISLLTLAIPLKFMTFHTSVIWLIEIPFLLCFGLVFDRRVFRYLSFSLAIFLFLKLLMFDFSMHGNVHILGYNFTWDKFMSLVGFISMSVSFYMFRYLKNKPALSYLEGDLYNIFSGLATIYLTIFIWLVVNARWLTFSLSFETLALFIFGLLLSDKYLRYYSLLLLIIVSFRFCFLDSYHAVSEALKWFIISVELVNLYSLYFLYRKYKNKLLLSESEKPLVNAVFVISTFLLIYTIYRYILHPWTSLALGISGVALFMAGFLSKDKIFRWGGFIVFAITVFRVIFVDLSMLHIIYKIISFIILGILFLGVSFVYTKYNIGKSKQ